MADGCSGIEAMTHGQHCRTVILLLPVSATKSPSQGASVRGTCSCRFISAGILSQYPSHYRV
jgi:hypothetical protein